MNDTFGRPIDLGDEVATIPNDSVPVKGIVIQIGKSGVKISYQYNNSSGEKTRWVTSDRAIKTGLTDGLG
jgi:hypothetical protein